ncbi:unnamed protein product [Meganyctiphanes norvegica]|uniref:Uncharacterized protein n=1 Tax=Meganyctiphanes norvegica TaxID=48144 RepID=A0AAV2RQX7_MEGNR
MSMYSSTLISSGCKCLVALIVCPVEVLTRHFLHCPSSLIIGVMITALRHFSLGSCEWMMTKSPSFGLRPRFTVPGTSLLNLMLSKYCSWNFLQNVDLLCAV